MARNLENEPSDRTVEILQAMPLAGFSKRRYANAYAVWRFFRRSPCLTNHRGSENTESEESDRSVEIL
ncbi:hypothetical protein H6G97_03435 [Nostoc flagelliforme FACHB-838]|uniref:Transposase n=1 Tax=Nostoc flagelliforme FACHB-838 TaxID=2692904 RepID=A0ABR8DI77_9NOSO|nr:hypothetical protein [Nostoc flagelliforme]MBD2528663.1 hypothetical protein [Nostoc flagelliforme FACHB-838]